VLVNSNNTQATVDIVATSKNSVFKENCIATELLPGTQKLESIPDNKTRKKSTDQKFYQSYQG